MKNYKLFIIPAGMVAVTLAAIFWPKKEASSEVEKEEPTIKPAPEGKQTTADEERKRLMAEMGRKGAEKSAQVRRAKKAAREALKNGTIPA